MLQVSRLQMPGMGEGMKFMLSLPEKLGAEMQLIADQRQITIQDLIRAVIIPEWKMATGKFKVSDVMILAKGEKP